MGAAVFRGALPAAMMLSGCAAATGPAATTSVADRLQGEWALIELNGAPVEGTMAFDGARLSAFAGCNRMGGAYRLEGARLEVASLAQTQMYCASEQPGGVNPMEVEAAVGAVLMADPLLVERDGGVLQLQSGTTSLLLRRR
jgi:heat shock protein HslJ